MNMLLLGTGALISGIVIGKRSWGQCWSAFDDHASDLGCMAILSGSYNWAITLIFLGVALLVAALIQGLRTLGRRSGRTRSPGPN
ncbi:hypothetical protein [Mycobacterium sp. E2733]|uniref:hypothetical protein n=1 Tax=Mycobacterium sp. E2733 TaxID=1834138 RepID=UPI0007FDF4AC|nr:hypothetical protein [Mycobacterium sp. E2733]OBI00389.1 hypothetical protein A5678_17930 [Mycobacterium sp. E2733]